MKIQNVILLVILLCNLCFTYEDRNRFPIHSFNLDISTLDSLYARQSKLKSFDNRDVQKLMKFCYSRYKINMNRFSISYATSYKNKNHKGFIICGYDNTKMYDLLIIYNSDSTLSYLNFSGIKKPNNQVKQIGMTYIQTNDSNDCFKVNSFRVFESALDSVKGMPVLFKIRREFDTSFVVCNLKKNK